MIHDDSQQYLITSPVKGRLLVYFIVWCWCLLTRQHLTYKQPRNVVILAFHLPRFWHLNLKAFENNKHLEKKKDTHWNRTCNPVIYNQHPVNLTTTPQGPHWISGTINWYSSPIHNYCSMQTTVHSSLVTELYIHNSSDGSVCSVT